MKLHILVEGKSEEVFLNGWLPKYIPQHTFQIIKHEGKGKLPRETSVPMQRRGLLDQLPMKLRAYGRALNSDTDRVLILVDQDEDDCRELKQRIQAAINAIEKPPVVMVRIATKETEAFYLGDPKAMRAAFPRINRKPLDDYSPDADPESGTWELFAQVIRAASEDKVGWAEKMAVTMSAEKPLPRTNKSTCFIQFCLAILTLVGEPVE